MFSWFGKFHLVILHFPIALVTLTVFCELLNVRLKHDPLNHASHVMLIAAAVTVVPTAILGQMLGSSEAYSGSLHATYWTHQVLGFASVLFIGLALFSRNKNGWLYGAALALAFITTNAAGFFGGELTFGLGHAMFG